MHKPWQWLETEAKQKLEHYRAEARIWGLIQPKSLRKRLAEALFQIAVWVDLEAIQTLTQLAKRKPSIGG